jgi:hypothetical protein
VIVSEPVNLRDAARRWITDAIAKHLHLEHCGADRVRQIAAGIEAEAHEKNVPIETAVRLAVRWCDEQNEAATRSHASLAYRSWAILGAQSGARGWPSACSGWARGCRGVARQCD